MTMGPEFRKYPEAFVVCFFSIILFYTTLAQDALEVQVSAVGKFGETAKISCSVNYNKANVTWFFGDKLLEIDSRITQSNATRKQTNPDIGELTYIVYNLTIANVTSQDSGNYTCRAQVEDLEGSDVAFLNLSFPPKYIKGKSLYEFKAAHASDEKIQKAELECDFEVYKPGPVQWYKKGSNNTITTINATQLTNIRIHSVYKFDKITNQDNGTYVCQVYYPENDTYVRGELTVIVYDKPNLFLDQVIGINKTELYLNWTVETHNSEIISYTLWYSPTSDSNMLQQYIDPNNNKKIAPNSTSLVMKGLKESTVYPIKLQVKTKHGESFVVKNGSTLNINPEFVPNISINGFSATSVTIGWQPPPKEIEHLIHYYLLEAKKADGGATRNAYHSKDEKNLPYMFDNLEPFSTYTFRVRACQDFTKTCGNWSKEMQAATLDGIPEEPDQVKIFCSVTQLNLTWEPPLKPNAEIKGYMIELTGNAVYRDRSGAEKKITIGPLAKFLSNDSKMVRFDDLQPNTEYVVRVSGMTRSRRRGSEAARSCRTSAAPPDQPPRPRWRKVLDNNRYFFKLYLPKASERNGPICCYRVYMVRMRPGTDLKDLKPQHQLPVVQYEEAHAAQPTYGAYITDIFTNDNYPNDGDVIMGDGRPFFNKSDPIFSSESCKRCLYKPERDFEPPPPKPTTTTTSTTTEDDDFDTTEETVEKTERRRRSYSSANDYANDAIMQNPQKLAGPRYEEVAVVDGALDSMSNYTMFVELIPGNLNDEPMFSDYVNVLMPAPTQIAPAPSSTFEIALQATCAVAALVLLLMIIFCVLQSRRSRKMPPHAHVEMNPIQAALRYVVGHMGGRQQLLPATPPELPALSKDQLAAAYIERHADTDLGFQKEFEMLQRLSECFPDRTTHASEARENQPKNRYPDIKAYDQTRVRLSQIDGIIGSDYINANYVMGYKDRKKFICAQGPTDTTVNDFWRMIWEHGLELIVMLTNLEEYSKVKCSKYWPDAGHRAFGAITVTHISETRYSDYIVRELKITKQPTNSEGQPIVENNGVSKRNGDINNTTDSAPTSPRDKQCEYRTVKQYHFLIWKDFAAPEHPHSILKFIKRVNEAWSNMIGRPLVVHCSAGVGRTGTLVALDCLLESLKHTGQVAVYNTVAELRRHRNYLVQSQKQYIFVYRALVEYAHYGDTEIPASKLSTSYHRLKNTPEGADKCLMEYEFEKLMEPPVPESKSCLAGAAEEARCRNRSLASLPYDRQRVLLAPLPARDHSTYINASFLEAYDNTEGYIITQDPLPNTIFDFWRMVSEQGINTIVMLSELGEGRCPRYWEDGTAQLEHISVQHEESEACPYYTRRQFRLTNTRVGSESVVRQLQYQGWPTAAGAVPEVTRGLAELADTAPDLPLLVHCQLGTERSALFVALCILISQLRAERRVDVSAVARKIRSQRANVIDTITQYEFLYRAILNYAELHNLLEDS